MDLFDCIRDTATAIGSIAPADPRDRDTATHVLELIEHAQTEYAFLTRFGSVARARPEPFVGLSASELKAWQEQIDVQLFREPLWGPYMERMWSHRLKELDAFESSLNRVP